MEKPRETRLMADTGTQEVLDQEAPPQAAEAPSTPSPRKAAEPTSEQVASAPAIQIAFERVIGKPVRAGKAKPPPTPERPAPKPSAQAKGAPAPTRRKPRQTREEIAEELGPDADAVGDELPSREEEESGVQDAPKPEKAAEAAAEAPPKEEGSDEVPTLNPLLRQAAKRGGMTDEEITELVKTNPDLAEKTFRRLLSSYNELSMRYGNLGIAPPAPARRPDREEGGNGDAAAEEEPLPPSPDTDFLQELYGQNRAALETKYGKDFFRDVLGPLVRPVAAMHRQTLRQEQQAMVAEISGFFKGLSPEFESIYGKEGSALGEEAIQHRRDLSKWADKIRNGARTHGEEMTVGEALDRANMLYASEHLAKLERKKLIEQVRKRSGQITQPPSRRAFSDSPKKGDEAAIDSATKAMKRLGMI
jgi:hypothetical protein